MTSKEKRSVDKESEGFTKKGILVSILVSLALTAVCIVFEVLCLKNFKIEFFVKYSTLLISLACAVTILYCLTAIFFCAKGKSTAYRVLLSGYLLIIFFLVLLFILQKTGFLEIFQNPDLYKEYLEKAGVWMPLLYIVLQYLQVVILPIPGVVSTLAGVALFGAVFTHVLQSNLLRLLPEGAQLPRALNPAAVQNLPAEIRLDYLDAFGSAIHAAFLIAACIMAVAFGY